MNIKVNNVDVEINDGIVTFKIDSKELEKMLSKENVELATLKPGEIFKSETGIEYIVLEQLENGTRVIRNELLPIKKEFGRNNNFSKSSIKDYLNGDYYENEVIKGFGKDNLVDREIDLLSNDGLDDYGKLHVKIGLLTIDDYRKYRKSCFKESKDSWWWLSTPNSTPTGYGDDFVQCVRSGGDVNYGGYDYYGGVRPDFILKSSIFVSLRK